MTIVKESTATPLDEPGKSIDGMTIEGTMVCTTPGCDGTMTRYSREGSVGRYSIHICDTCSRAVEFIP